MLAADNASTPQEEQPTVDSPSTNGPLNTINLSLKRIRLNEETSTAHQLIASRTDSIEQEWVMPFWKHLIVVVLSSEYTCNVDMVRRSSQVV